MVRYPPFNYGESTVTGGRRLALKKFRNPYLKWTNFGLIICGLSLLLLGSGFVIRRDTAPTLFILGSIGVVAGLSIFCKCRSLAKQVDEVLAGHYITHWMYEPDEWRRYLVAEFPRWAGDVANTSPEAYIWRGGILINNRCYWFGPGRPHEVLHIPGSPSLIQFGWKVSYQGGGKSESQLRVPVPVGREGEAQEVVNRFGSTWKKELRRLSQGDEPDA